MLQPVVWGGQERAEYTVGVAGCDQRMTYIVICPQIPMRASPAAAIASERRD